MKLQVAGFLDNSTVNGKGLRSALFLSGCKHNCEGCHNKAMQAFDYGERVEVDDILERIKHNVPLINGVTFSGGEPFEQAKQLATLAKKVRDEGLNLWCYTGYTFEQILQSGDEHKLELLKYIDVLVDGKFQKDLTEGSCKYAGSKNQRVIDVKESVNSNNIIEINKE
ncbi:anaerobic ribonucleoside-triphosphate reductase activating protein [Clostridium ganghwense]|uniref:Anaerobic ribonucleoside-triphosphate reductase-activating protein n=1 Tax=Clostridium ganghwense TaxID=312089 RepID=A0ABT4CLU4_9CLOT|nr:anaerobic ribonucleoside-triphosphate reductase activating protein [Clostridium ganghwense]MCY6370020.1 anaerobic ribonucleoside-triphosphate reductase activating protein [Clostridium ganghwense]